MLAPAASVGVSAGGAAQVPVTAPPGIVAAAVQLAADVTGHTVIGRAAASAPVPAICTVAVPAICPVFVTVNDAVLVRLLGRYVAERLENDACATLAVDVVTDPVADTEVVQ